MRNKNESHRSAGKHVENDLGIGGGLSSEEATTYHLAQITELDLKDSRVTDLGPLVRCPGLESLNIANTNVTDLGPLAQLTNLKVLYLGNTQISTVETDRLQRMLPSLAIVRTEGLSLC